MKSYHSLSTHGVASGGIASSLGLALEMFVVSSLFLALPPLLTPIAQSFNATTASVAAIPGAYSLCFGCSTVAAAMTSDHFSPRLLLLCGAGLHSMAFACLALAPNLWTLLIAAGLAGIAAGFLQPTVYRIALASAPEAQRAAWVGRLSFGWSVALTLGVPACLLIASLVNWRIALLVVLLLWAPVLFLVRPLLVGFAPATPQSSLLSGLLKRLPIYFSSFLVGLAFYAMYFFYGAAHHDISDNELALSLDISCFGAGCVVGSTLVSSVVRRCGLALSFRAASLTMAAVLAALPLLLELRLGFAGTLLWGVTQMIAVSTLVLALAHEDANNLGMAMAVSALAMMLGASAASLLGGTGYERYGYDAIAAGAVICLVLAVVWSAWWWHAPGSRLSRK